MSKLGHPSNIYSTPRQLTAQDLLHGVPTVSGPVRPNRKLGHPEPAQQCVCIREPIPLDDGRDLKCGRELGKRAA